ncbi:MAG: Na+/H+ antiporter subunit E [Deltaproteobacteria bacterium]|nr:Na+/H+ antiporter subunit E [Deltaproteobacteria bacterium]
MFAHLAVFWLLWSGHFEPALLAYGLLSCALVLVVSLRLDVVDPEALPVHFGLRPILYLPWLFVEIAKANVDVAKIILSPTLRIYPHLIRVPARQRSEVGQVTYANSITLTPGTISLDVRDDQILVHALTKEAAAGVESGEMDRRVAWMEGLEEAPRRQERRKPRPRHDTESDDEAQLEEGPR